MSAPVLTRVLRQHRPSWGLNSSHRTYSSFFSSNKSGGGGNGRYFNSTKVPKAVVPNAANKNRANKAKNGDAAAADTPDNVHAASSGSSGINAKSEQEQAPNSAATAPEPSGAAIRASEAAASQSSMEGISHERSLHALLRDTHQQIHPSVTSKDFKINQFFSLHRPLLLLSNPSTILEAPPANSTFGPSPSVDLASEAAAVDKAPSAQRSIWLLDESPEATLDADAAAARQLARALTMTHAGAAVAWEDTMRRLGLDVTKEVERVEMQEQMEREWEDVMMESTKRKRKKKMRKHKLKKRRKATRATRLKLR